MTALLDTLQHTTEAHVKQRRPLLRKPAARVADIKQYNPQFEEEYVAGKDYDPDRYLSVPLNVFCKLPGSLVCCEPAVCWETGKGKNGGKCF